MSCFFIISTQARMTFGVLVKFYKKRVKITASLKICYIKFYFATNIKLYFMKGDCNIIL